MSNHRADPSVSRKGLMVICGVVMFSVALVLLIVAFS